MKFDNFSTDNMHPPPPFCDTGINVFSLSTLANQHGFFGSSSMLILWSCIWLVEELCGRSSGMSHPQYPPISIQYWMTTCQYLFCKRKTHAGFTFQIDEKTIISSLTLLKLKAYVICSEEMMPLLNIVILKIWKPFSPTTIMLL